MMYDVRSKNQVSKKKKKCTPVRKQDIDRGGKHCDTPCVGTVVNGPLKMSLYDRKTINRVCLAVYTVDGQRVHLTAEWRSQRVGLDDPGLPTFLQETQRDLSIEKYTFNSNLFPSKRAGRGYREVSAVSGRFFYEYVHHVVAGNSVNF